MMTAFLIILLLVNAVVLYLNAFRCFNFYDMSIGIDGAWRILCGQHPYIDFFHFIGPVQIYLNALFFRLFGVTKIAFWAELVTVQTVVTLLVFFLAKKYLSRPAVVIVTLLSTTCFYWPIAHPWHDHTAYFFGLIGVACCLWILPFNSRRQALGTGMVCGIATVLAVFSKTNIGAFYGVVFFLLMLASPKPLSGLAGLFLGSLAGLLISWPMVGSYPVFIRAMMDYFSVAGPGRFSRLTEIHRWVANYYWATFLLVGIGSLRSWIVLRSWVVLFLGILFIAVCGAATGSVMLEYDIFLWGVHILLALIVLELAARYFQDRQWRGSYLLNRIMYWCVMIEAVALTGMAVMESSGVKVWSYRSSEDYLGTYPVAVKGIEGWKFSARQGPIVEDMVDFIENRIPEGESLLILNDLTALYALTGRESFPGMPSSSLVPGHTPAPGEQLERVQKILRRNPPDWVLTDISTYMTVAPYLKFREILNKDYRVVHQWGNGYYVMMKRIGP